MANTLEESPEFQAALNEACEKQYSGWLYGGSAVKAKDKSKIDGVMREIQHRKREAERMRESLALRASAMGFHMPNIPTLPDEITRESMEKYREEMQRHSDRIRAEAERQTNPHFREITENLKRRQNSGGLVCPKCHDIDHGNRMNGKPWCMKCNVPLMTPEKAKDWKPPEKPLKFKDYTFNEPEGVTRARRK